MSYDSWSARDEIAFIDGLGTHTGRKVTPAAVEKLLRGYSRSLRKRVVWTGIDRGAVEAHVEKKLYQIMFVEKENT